MKPVLRGLPAFALCCAFAILSLSSFTAQAQSCETSSELDDATRSAMTAAGQRYFEMAAKGDVASMRQNSIPSLAADFSAVENRVKDRQQELTSAQATVRTVFRLDASESTPLQHAEFLCGVFGKNGQTPGSAAIYLDNLPPGTYAVVLLDVVSANSKTMFSEILQQVGTDWKLAGLYIVPALVAGHDGDWFLARAREYKARGQLHNAWLFSVEARNLISPLPFMYTLATDKIYDEWHSQQPADLPADGKTVDFVAGTVSYKLTAAFPTAVGNDIDLVVKYESANAANSTQAYQENLAVIKALVAKYPELRDAFTAVVARAVDTAGHDYGTLLAMKDIK